MKVTQGATGNEGVWVTFIAIVLLYIGLAITTILVLRNMSRRFKRQDALDDRDVPYGPRELPEEDRTPEPIGG
jgi:cytochrome d ubiquinol oxidase subunit I